jgi:5-methylcytosine-specific restriction endonuclease McrA
MDYQKIYDKLCENGQKPRQLDGYVEKHHIIPKCLGGSNGKDNLTTLTYREHYVAHLILCKLYPKHRGIQYAFLCMLRKQPTGERLLTSRMFDVIKKNFSKFKKLYCTIENPGKSQKSRDASRKRMTERNPMTLNPSKNRTAQPIRIHFEDGHTEDYSYAKEYCLKSGVPYSTIKPLMRAENSKCKKHGIKRIERL